MDLFTQITIIYLMFSVLLKCGSAANFINWLLLNYLSVKKSLIVHCDLNKYFTVFDSSCLCFTSVAFHS